MSQLTSGKCCHLGIFSDRLEKHKVGVGRLDLVSCQVSINSVQRFQRRSRKCFSKSAAGAAILFFWSARKNTNLVEDVNILLPVKFRWIPFSCFRREVQNASANKRLWRPSCFSDQPEKHKLGRGRWDLASCQHTVKSTVRGNSFLNTSTAVSETMTKWK